MPNYFAHISLKRLAAASLVVLVFFCAYVMWYRWDSETNHGFQFGYYGEFNRFGSALASIPGVTVTQSWANLDLSLEEFGFAATTSRGVPLRIAVGERDPIRSLSGELLVQAISAEVERQTKK